MKKFLSLIMAALVICSFTFMALGSGTDAETSSNGTGTDTSNASNTSDIPVYGVGESVSLKTSTGEYTVKITSVEETTKRNQFSDVKADKVILVAYEYENVSYTNDLSVSTMNMKVYDKDSNLLESYPALEQKYGSAVGTGRKSNGVAAYALNNENNYIEIDFYDNIINSKADCRFKIEW